jgi:hypothetical protein
MGARRFFRKVKTTAQHLAFPHLLLPAQDSEVTGGHLSNHIF